MLQATVIGNVGADAQVQNKDGREFVTFRVAHNDTWTGQDGVQHTNVIWVDCVMNGHPKVTEFIKAGTQVVVIGNVSLRVYSSAKDKCMKAGMTVNVANVQLLGGSTDEVPRRLYDANGVQHDVDKWYLTDVKQTQLMSQRGQQFAVDAYGWVKPIQQQQPPVATAPAGAQQQQAQQPVTQPTDVNADGSPVQIF